MLSPEALSKIAHIRSKVADNTVTKEELREAVIMIREGRLTAQTRTESAKRVSARKAIPTADELLGDLLGDEA